MGETFLIAPSACSDGPGSSTQRNGLSSLQRTSSLVCNSAGSCMKDHLWTRANHYLQEESMCWARRSIGCSPTEKRHDARRVVRSKTASVLGCNQAAKTSTKRSAMRWVLHTLEAAAIARICWKTPGLCRNRDGRSCHGSCRSRQWRLVGGSPTCQMETMVAALTCQ